jgi:hypothetical protein
VADPKTYTEDEYNAMIAERDALKANRDQALTEAKAAKKKLADYDGVDAAEYKALKEANAEAERKKALAEGNLETWKKQVTDQHQKERETDAKRIAKLTAALDKRKVAKLTEALAKADAVPEMMDLLVLKGSAAVRLRETDDDWEEYVGDEKGNPLVADGQGSPMSIQQFVEKSLKAQYPGAFKGSGSSGGGATKSTASGGGSLVSSDGRAFLDNLKDLASGAKTMSLPAA